MSLIACGIPDKRMGKSFPSASIFGTDTVLSMVDDGVSIGGAGADKLVTEATNAEEGGGEEEEDATLLSVVSFDVYSLMLEDVEANELISGNVFAVASEEEDRDLINVVGGVDEIVEASRGGALKI